MGLIRVTDLAVGHPDKPLARRISFTLKRRKILAVLGSNGAGKMTLVRTLLGLIPPLNGDTHLNGATLCTLSRRQIARAMAYLVQALTAPFPYTLADFVLMGRTAHQPRFGPPSMANWAAVTDALRKREILPLAGSSLMRLSGGKRQLALIVLDEPETSLYFRHSPRLLDQLRDLANERAALILATREPDHGARPATRILSLDRLGQVRLGSPDKLTTPAHLAHLSALLLPRHRREPLPR